jgi:hypothetical protein
VGRLIVATFSEGMRAGLTGLWPATKGSVIAAVIACLGSLWCASAFADFNKATEHFQKGEYGEAARQLQPLVDAGDAAALNAMGILLNNGYGSTKDARAAADLFRRSAEKGHPEGQRNWSISLRTGTGVPKDERQANQWLTRSANQGDQIAQRHLGLLNMNGDSLPKDVPQALRWLTKAAEQGDAYAQYTIGWSFARGVGAVKDEAAAAIWYKKSADQGEAEAQRELGFALFHGRGINKDQPAGIQWLKSAAEQGDVVAQVNLGKIHRNGWGVAKDDKEANRWYRRAAESKNAEAQAALGIASFFGYGVDKDDVEAVRWYRLAAAQGYAIALTNLGSHFEYGTGGVLQDYVEAARHYEAAAMQGEPYGQRNLARMYREGLGVRSDAVVAYAWANLAASAETPHPKAAAERDAMKQYMPNSLVAEGQRLAREWKLGMALGKSKLRPVEVASLLEASESKQGRSGGATRVAPSGQFPLRPEAKPGLVTCNTSCTNGDCLRTYDDGRKIRFQALQKWNTLSNQFEWDPGHC